jgi:hypothetical protein
MRAERSVLALAVLATPLGYGFHAITRGTDGEPYTGKLVLSIVTLVVLATILSRPGDLRRVLDRFPLVFLSVAALLTVVLLQMAVYGIVAPDRLQMLDTAAWIGRVVLCTLLFVLGYQLSADAKHSVGVLVVTSLFSIVIGLLALIYGLGQLGTADAEVLRAIEVDMLTPSAFGNASIPTAMILGGMPALFYLTRRMSAIVLMLALPIIALSLRRSAMAAFAGYMLVWVVANRAFAMVGVAGLLGLLGLAGLGGLAMVDPSGGVMADTLRAKLLDSFGSDGGTGSGRYVFWGIILDNASEAGLIELLIGQGAGTIPKLLMLRFGTAIGAHNDWLDFGVNFGVVGLLAAWVPTFGLLIYAVSNRDSLGWRATSIAVSLSLVLLAISLLAGGIFDPYFGPAFATLGFALGYAHRAAVEPRAVMSRSALPVRENQT